MIFVFMAYAAHHFDVIFFYFSVILFLERIVFCAHWRLLSAYLLDGDGKKGYRRGCGASVKFNTIFLVVFHIVEVHFPCTINVGKQISGKKIVERSYVHYLTKSFPLGTGTWGRFDFSYRDA